MEEVVCPLCCGRGGDVTIECRNCGGTGYDPEEDKPFAQCHTCFGEQVEELEICPRCDGARTIYIDEDDMN